MKPAVETRTITISTNVYKCGGISDSPEMKAKKTDAPERYDEILKDNKRIKKLGLINRKQIQELSLKYEYDVWETFDWKAEVVKTEKVVVADFTKPMIEWEEYVE